MTARGSRRESATPVKIEWDPLAEVRCVHMEECGACPLMPERYEVQRASKLKRLHMALDRYEITPTRVAEGGLQLPAAEHIRGYRRRAKLVVSLDSSSGDVAVGLFRRNDNQEVVDIPHCQVLSPALVEVVAQIRDLASEAVAAVKPGELTAILKPSNGETGVLQGIDIRELCPPKPAGDDDPLNLDLSASEDASHQILLTLILVAERAPNVEVMRDAARALRRRFPQVIGVAVSLRYTARHQSNSELICLSGVPDAKDDMGGCYQLASHASFLQVHRAQALHLYGLLRTLVSAGFDGEPGPKRVLDLYGGTGAIALSIAAAGYQTMLVESYPPAAALASRAAQAQRLPVEVVTGDVASVAKALAAAKSKFDVVVANPPRRGLSPAARESIAALSPRRIVYVACDLNNLSRDLDHLSRLGYQAAELYPLDMLPLTEEVEVVAVLERRPVPVPDVLYQGDDLVALDKPPHEPVQEQPEFPGSLVGRARRTINGGEWHTVLKIEAGTSGVTLFAASEAAAAQWTAALTRTGRLVYLAAVRGVTPAKGAITRELRGAEGARTAARTRYRRLAIGGGHSVLRVVPEKRYVHQIRRHMAAVGHPVLGDARYGHGPTNRYFEEKHGLDRSFLHLVRVELDHPVTGERMLIEAPLPADLRAALVRSSDESVLRFLEKKRALGGRGTRCREPAPQRGTEGVAPPASERSPLSVVEPDRESVYPSQRIPMTQRTPGALEYDDAPRTVRGELLSQDED